ncbi:hypothetical protein evm_002761 [Chilo suppressalis]|nr:hypothetical protein evm_002761 [Chilo suppressalis]
MGIRLIILLALLVGVLYCLHLLVKDYQALTAPRLLRFLFKRDVNSFNNTVRPGVRWKMILMHDPIQCARYLFCDLGSRSSHTDVQKGFIYMLTLEPRQQDILSHEVFLKAYNYGTTLKEERYCKTEYPLCPFDSKLLFELIEYLLKH